jgi:hypothetical protein
MFLPFLGISLASLALIKLGILAATVTLLTLALKLSIVVILSLLTYIIWRAIKKS